MGNVIVTAATMRGDMTQVVRVEGELAFDTAIETRARLDRLLFTDVARVVIDIAALTMLDSSGLAVLIAVWKRLGREGRRLELRNAGGQPLRLLTITGCASLFIESGSDTAALRSVG